MKNKIKTLLYLRKELDAIIDNYITEYVLREKDINTSDMKESLIYHIEENLNDGAFK